MRSCGNHREEQSHCIGEVEPEPQMVEYRSLEAHQTQTHCEVTTALSRAKEYILELESREKSLQAENSSLVKKLRAKQAELDDQPEEFKALKVDLQQAQLRIAYYRNLANDSEVRANRYQRKLASAEQKQSVAEDQARKMELLHAELEHQQTINTNLSKEINTMADRYVLLLEPYKQQLEEKSCLISLLNGRIDELVEERAASAQISEAYDSLIDTLEHERSEAAQMVNIKSLCLRDTDSFYSALCSELDPLHRFYENACTLIHQYQVIFSNLSDPSVLNFATSSPEIEAVLDTASNNLHGFRQISDMLRIQDDTQNLARQTLRVQIDNIATSAGHINTHLHAIKRDIPGCLMRLQITSGVWTLLKNRLLSPFRSASIASRTHPDSNMAPSRRSSASSLVSWTGCFAGNA